MTQPCPRFDWCVLEGDHTAHRTQLAEFDGISAFLLVVWDAATFIGVSYFSPERADADAHLRLSVADAEDQARIYARLGHPELAAHLTRLAYLAHNETAGATA